MEIHPSPNPSARAHFFSDRPTADDYDKNFKDLSFENREAIYGRLTDAERKLLQEFESLKPIEKAGFFDRLSDSEKKTIFKYASDAQRANILKVLSDADKVQFFKGLDEEEKIVFFRYLEQNDKKL